MKPFVNAKKITMASEKTSLLTAQELTLKSYLRFLFFAYLTGFFVYLLPAFGLVLPFLQPFAFLKDPAFASMATARMALCAALCFLAAADVRRYLVMAEAMIVVLVLAVLTGVVVALWALNNDLLPGSEKTFYIKQVMLAAVFLDAVLAAVLIVFYTKAQKRRYGLHYLSPLQFRTLEALSDVLIQGENELVSPREVALKVDRYMSSFLAKTKWISKVALTGIQLYPLLFLKPPISYMRPEDRKAFLERHFYQNVALRLAPPFVRMLVQAMIRMGKQLCFMGYYNDPKVQASINYKPFSEREDAKQRLATLPYENRQPLYVLHEKDIKGDRIDWDGVVIVGSGPGASIMAKGLAEKGIPVLMLERGEHTDPSQFNEDEIEMASKLYADGALQLAADFRFQVIQGSAVGGTSVVNNAVCFDTPDYVLDRWNDRNGIDAGLDLDRYKKSNQRVNKLIEVRSVVPDRAETMALPEYLNPGGEKFIEGITRLGLDKMPNAVGTIAANIRNCVGCGYCNIGCKWGKKLSMLNNILPQVQKELGTEKCKIIAGCEVLKLHTKGGKIISLTARFGSGRKLEVLGKTFVVAAGAVSSSLLLQRSGIAAGRAGKRLSFNISSPITAVFQDEIHSYNGLQISHYLRTSPNPGYIFETWFSPPMFQSTIMPGWWDQHWKNMQRYSRMACTGVLVASDSNAEVREGGLTRREIRYKPTRKDFETMLAGLELAGDIYLAANAECVIPNTFHYLEYATKEQLKMMKYDIKDDSDITLGTGHPQGGNILSRNKKEGVVDEQLRVYGYDNLFITDASVFPTAIGVNPQITVMTLSDYAVPFVAETISAGGLKILMPELNKI